MNEKNNLLESYLKTIKSMNLKSVYPYTETEVQPSYKDDWNLMLDKIIDKYDFSIDVSSWCLNYSIIRSMLIMDMMYHPDKDKIFNFYKSILVQVYQDNDIFSLNSNLPNYKIDHLIYGTKVDESILVTQILTILHNMCYTSYQDIYADNGYEICGPFVIPDHKIVYSRFSFHKLKKIEVINFYNPDVKITIDLFGHIRFENECQNQGCTIWYDGVEVKDLLYFYHKLKVYSLFVNNLSLYRNELIYNLDCRISRYEKLLNILNIPFDTNVIKSKLVLTPRITNYKKLLLLFK